MKAKLVILRHGQTEYNEKSLMTGTRDVALTEKGIGQAKEVGAQLVGTYFDHVYASTLSRAFNTAALVLESSCSNRHLKNPDGIWQVTKDIRLIEGDAGDFTGLCHKTDPAIRAFERSYARPMPNGESEKQVVERVTRFYEAEILPRLERGENVLVVCHAGVVRAFDYALGLVVPPKDDEPTVFRSILNATPVIFDYEDGKLVNPKAADKGKKGNPPCKNLKP